MFLSPLKCCQWQHRWAVTYFSWILLALLHSSERVFYPFMGVCVCALCADRFPLHIDWRLMKNSIFRHRCGSPWYSGFPLVSSIKRPNNGGKRRGAPKYTSDACCSIPFIICHVSHCSCSCSTCRVAIGLWKNEENKKCFSHFAVGRSAWALTLKSGMPHKQGCLSLPRKTTTDR